MSTRTASARKKRSVFVAPEAHAASSNAVAMTGLRMDSIARLSRGGKDSRQMPQTALGLLGSPALDGQNAVERGGGENIDDALPIDDPIAASTTNGRTGHFT